ncbi:ABC-F family ATP-binding cassette domain-containing protein [Herbaspirillum robiniae]|uniref:ABC-F family ATP-binding cassette domain-containing protein n=1 Tax=Herbaspirillum robiniae TaxID=2014887 RepID=UPI003D77253A
MTMLRLQGLSLAFPHKTCFSDFDGVLDWGRRVAVVGDNGCGKSSLLQLLRGALAPDAGRIVRADGLRIGYVPQLAAPADSLSGGQAANRALSRALADAPELLLLDEPTNHLDAGNRRSLTRMLAHFPGAILLVTHDAALLDALCDTVWHIEDGRIHCFQGRYADFLAEQELRREAIDRQLASLRREQGDAHQARMQEQLRASKARQRGERAVENHRWATIKSATKLGRGNQTAGRKQAAIAERQQALADERTQLRRAPAITPRFQLAPGSSREAGVLHISAGSAGYAAPVVSGLHLEIARGERVALTGANGSGKSTVARAIAGIAPARRMSGQWHAPPAAHIGYLDQHYAQLMPGASVLDNLRAVADGWSMEQLRRWLADFLFRGEHEVHADVATLSGGEKARLSLACIAARPPALLVLDEVTNNLDRRTRTHVIDVLRDYPGAMLLISHDDDFLQPLGEVRRVPL